MNSEPKASWDSTWDQVFLSQEWGKYPPEHVIRFIARNFYKVSQRNQIKILDFGCGPGACAWYIAREGFSVAGIDGSSTAICQATERLRRENLTADLRVGDYIELPWPDGHFDAVVDNFTLCCNRMTACCLAVKEVYRVLKPGGRFLSSNFTDLSYGYGLGNRAEPGGFAEIKEGPLKGKGFCLFMSRSQVDELYAPFLGFKTEKTSFTTDEMRHVVESWIVEGQKPGRFEKQQPSRYENEKTQ